MLTIDWKHLIYEDYDDWLFNGIGSPFSADFDPPEKRSNSTMRHPDVFIVNMGLHTCYHAYEHGDKFKVDYIQSQTKDIERFMLTMHTAVKRLRKLGMRAHRGGQGSRNQHAEVVGNHLNGSTTEAVSGRQKTVAGTHLHHLSPTVVVVTAGRAFYRNNQSMRREIDLCIVHMNRAVTRYAHKYGFHVSKAISNYRGS